MFCLHIWGRFQMVAIGHYTPVITRLKTDENAHIIEFANIIVRFYD